MHGSPGVQQVEPHASPVGQQVLPPTQVLDFLLQQVDAVPGRCRPLLEIGPFGNPSMSTVFRADFLDGESYAHMLAPGEDRWDIPPGSSPDAPSSAERAR